MELPGDQKSPPREPLAILADQVMTRVAAVWVWTVLFAASTTITYATGLGNIQMLAALSVNPGWSRGNLAGTILLRSITPLMAGVATVLLIVSWLAQYRYFKGYLLEIVLFNREAIDDENRRRLARRDLSRGYRFLLYSLLLRLLPEALSGLLVLTQFQ